MGMTDMPTSKTAQRYYNLRKSAASGPIFCTIGMLL